MLICGICTRQIKQPKYLPCHHSFCFECIVDILRFPSFFFMFPLYSTLSLPPVVPGMTVCETRMADRHTCPLSSSVPRSSTLPLRYLRPFHSPPTSPHLRTHPTIPQRKRTIDNNPPSPIVHPLAPALSPPFYWYYQWSSLLSSQTMAPSWTLVYFFFFLFPLPLFSLCNALCMDI